eukprot:gene19852-25802_t
MNSRFIDDDDITEIPMATVITSRPTNLDGKLKSNDLHSIGDRNRKKSSTGGFSSLAGTTTNYPKSKQSNEEPSIEIKDVRNWPPQLKEQIIKSLKRPPNVDRANNFFDKHNWPVGFREEVYKSCKKVAMRFYIIDDSGSMITNDGKRVAYTESGEARVVKCTRWSELSESISFLAEMSEHLEVPSQFQLLNGADPVIVGLQKDNGDSYHFLKEALGESPAGATPLCSHIKSIVVEISSIADVLKRNGQKVAVIIATDGESSDGNVANALQPLTNLPVLVILRLCTNEKEVIRYWDSIDNQLELDIDVLDDQIGDGAQVIQKNGWLTYGAPIHRMREFGSVMKEFDIIDESLLSSEQMRIICATLFLEGKVSALPHPGADWVAFLQRVKQLNASTPKVFCANTEKMKPWIDINKLARLYASGNGSSSVCALS